jgi:hypothetical protein
LIIETFEPATHMIIVGKYCLFRTNTRGHGYKLKKLGCNFSTRQHFFSLRMTDMSNSLPDDIVGSPRMNAFKNRRDKAMEKYIFRFEMPSTISNPCGSLVPISNYRQSWKDPVKWHDYRSSVNKAWKGKESATGHIRPTLQRRDHYVMTVDYLIYVTIVNNMGLRQGSCLRPVSTSNSVYVPPLPATLFTSRLY